MSIEFIFTFDSGPQEFKEAPIYPELLGTPLVLVAYAMTHLTHKQRQSLIKISCCLFCPNFVTPKWYDEQQGKIWIDTLEPWRKMHNIPSTVDRDIIDEFYSNNS